MAEGRKGNEGNQRKLDDVEVSSLVEIAMLNFQPWISLSVGLKSWRRVPIGRLGCSQVTCPKTV